MINGFPESIAQSVLFTVAACTLTSISLLPGFGMGTSLTHSTCGEPYCVRMTAFILLQGYVNLFYEDTFCIPLRGEKHRPYGIITALRGLVLLTRFEV